MGVFGLLTCISRVATTVVSSPALRSAPCDRSRVVAGGNGVSDDASRLTTDPVAPPAEAANDQGGVGEQPRLVGPPEPGDQLPGDESWLQERTHYEAVSDALASMVWTADGAHGVDYLSAQWQVFTGTPLEQLLGHGILELIHEADRGAMTGHLADLLKAPEEIRFRLRRADGQWRWMEARLRVVESEAAPRALGVTADITERVEAEQQLKRRNQQLAATLDLAQMGGFTWHFGPDGVPTGLTPDGPLAEILGLPADQLDVGGQIEGSDFMEMIHPDDRAGLAERVAEAIAGNTPGGEYRAEYRLLRPTADGAEERWVATVGKVNFGPDGMPTEMVGVLQDITSRRRSEQGRIRMQKLEAIATLAGGVAHDFGNVVGAILGNTRVAQAEVAAGVDPTATLDDIARATDRARELVERLVSFASPQEPSHEPLDLPALVEEAVALVGPVVGRGVDISTETLGTLPDVVGDAGQIHQVLVNLITNAGHAIDGPSGTISVTLDHIKSGRPYARMRVTDNGVGMSPEVATRVFDPFFTTRGAHGGTGLGLAAVQSIVNAHRGSVDVTSEPAGGTTFSVLLPSET